MKGHCEMRKILKSPGKYVQGAGILGEIDEYLQGMGRRLLILISRSGTKRICPTLDACFQGKDYELHYEIFQGECSQTQIDRLTAVWRYLCARGLGDLVPSRELRFVERLACWEVPDEQNIDGAAKARLVGEFPAMLARLTNAEGKFITLHRTYLTADGSKAPVHSAKKLASGAVENGVIRLYPAGGVVCLAEGIETALSVHALTGLPAWSVVSLSGMKRFGPETIPDGVRTIRICGDNDRSYAGAAGAYELASRLRRSRPELEVSVHIPQAAGTDWNDVLLAHGMLKL